MKYAWYASLIPLGAVAGYWLAITSERWQTALIYVADQLIFEQLIWYVLAGIALAATVAALFRQTCADLGATIRRFIRRTSLFELLVCLIGAVIGLLLARILPSLSMSDSVPILIFRALFEWTCAALGTIFFYRRRKELHALFQHFQQRGDRAKVTGEGDAKPAPSYKILDTSVIIDGRIADLCKTGFVEGTVVIPEFVLDELQHIADSADLLKRNRGRRGLDILNKMQKELAVPVMIYEGRFADGQEVDSRLLKLAKHLGGKVVTNDFNLNKVCELQGVGVLNINDLANAIKPVVLPGEEMTVSVIKDGKESGQGVAYLDDGTMIVVEGGKDFIGATLNVIVTSVLQTSAGRMIFARLKLLEKAL